MRLQNVLALTHGKLLNTPFVNTFNNIVFKAKHVKRGDLFMAFDDESIDIAVENGAYGIIFCLDLEIQDNEIAWIQVEDLDEALKRLLRFRLIDKDIVVYETNEIVLKLALQVLSEPNFLAIHGNIREIATTLWDTQGRVNILFCPALVSRDIFTKTIELSNTSFDHITVIEQTLFETSFIYNDIFYERQLLSPFFLPYLEILLHFLKTLDIQYRLRKFTPIEHFEAVFTNKKFEIKEFGTSDKVLIFEKNSSMMEEEILFLQNQATWGKLIYLVPNVSANFLQKIKNPERLLVYKNKNEIISLLKKSDFHFALVVGTDKSILSKPFVSQNEVSLFDFTN